MTYEKAVAFALSVNETRLDLSASAEPIDGGWQVVVNNITAQEIADQISMRVAYCVAPIIDAQSLATTLRGVQTPIGDNVDVQA